MSDEKSELSGSQPENTEVPKDEKADSSAAQDDKEKPSDSEQPWHKDPRFKQDLKLLKVAKSLVEANGLEDVDDLVDLVASGKKVFGKQVDLDKLDEIAQKAETLDRYQKHWQQQEELRKRGMETPEQTIARLQAEREDISNRYSAKEKAENDAKEAKKAIAFYEGEVKAQVNSIEDLSPEAKDFLSYTLGIGNECNDINITDKREIRRITQASVKKMNNLVKAIKDQAIKEYREGKASIPNVPSTDGSAATSKTEPTLKNSRERKNAFLEFMTKGRQK
jgi:hypothetical protein